MLMRHFKFEAHPIGSEASVETMESYKSNLDYYRENDFTFIPIPDEGMFYDRRNNELKEIHNQQYIDYDHTARWAIDTLTKRPFLLFENYTMDNTALIITAADLNKRVAKEMMFSLLADLENTFAEIIEQECPDSQSLFSEISPPTIGRWKKAGVGGIQMHITEYMNLSEMQKVTGKSEELRSHLGFDSRNQFDKQMSGIIDLRNRIMHANRRV